MQKSSSPDFTKLCKAVLSSSYEFGLDVYTGDSLTISFKYNSNTVYNLLKIIENNRYDELLVLYSFTTSKGLYYIKLINNYDDSFYSVVFVHKMLGWYVKESV